jgi:PAS domain S-box-containing protein
MLKTVEQTPIPAHSSWPVDGGALGALIREHKWPATPLGPIETWPQSLKTAVDLVLACRFPMVVLWGSKLIQIYNDGYCGLMGQKHPAGLGQPTRACWPEVWHINEPIYARIWGGETLTFEDQLYPITRYGYRERAYFTLCYSPVRAESGEVGGVLVTVFETTRRLQAEHEHQRAEAVLRESEERQAFLLKLSDTLRPLADAAAIQGEATRLLREQFEVGWCSYLEFNEDLTRGIALQDARRAGLPSLAMVHDTSDIPEFFDYLQSGRMLNVPDFASGQFWSPRVVAQYSAMGVRSVLGAPLVKHGQLIALLVMVDTAPRAWSESAVTLLSEVAERTWAALERARAEAALHESEARARTLIANLPGGAVFIVDHNLRYQMAEGEAFRAAGLSADAFVGRTVDEAVGPVQAEAHISYFRQALAGVPFELEHIVFGRVFLTRGVPLRDEVGRVYAALAVSTDVTEQRRAEASLRESEQRFRLLVENVQEYALFQTDPEGLITSWNPGAERLFGYPSAEVLGQSATRLLTSEDRAAGMLAKEIAQVMTGERQEKACWLLRKDGTRFWARWVTEPVRDETGRLRGVVKVLRDETERQRIEQTILSSLAEKEELLKEVHHRVKNNLQVITSLINLQAAQIEDGRVLALFDETRNRVYSIAAIHELLYRSTSLASIHLADYARQLVPDLVRLYDAQERIETKVEGDGVTLELQRAVPYGLLLNELVSNACKHAFPGGQRGEFTVSLRCEEGHILATVTDTGVGLPSGFDYRQASSLGLRLVHSLTRQLGGTVTVRSGPGTTVEVRLPQVLTQEKEGGQ